MLAACPSPSSFDRKCGRLCNRRTYSVACTTCKILQMNTEARKTLFQATISWSTPVLNYVSYICIFLVWASDVLAGCTLTYELMSWAISAPYPQHIATGWPFGNLKARFSWFWVWGCYAFGPNRKQFLLVRTNQTMIGRKLSILVSSTLRTMVIIRTWSKDDDLKLFRAKILASKWPTNCVLQ